MFGLEEGEEEEEEGAEGEEEEAHLVILLPIKYRTIHTAIKSANVSVTPT